MSFKSLRRINATSCISLILFFFASLLSISTVQAQDYYRWSPPRPIPQASPVRVDIINDRGRSFRQIPTDSKAYNIKRNYLEAKKGQRYSLRLRNTSNQRIGVVIAVDGRNILSGKKSWLRSNEKMYILDAYETATYKGWRTGKNQVNRFFFTNAGNSYANAWGDNTAMGVIAVAVFNEKPRYTHFKNKSFDSNSLRRRAPAAAEEAGTGFGREEYSPTIKVKFKPLPNPASKHFLKYEWRASLCKRGVISCRQYPKPKPHNRFWPENGYAPYPPGWQQNSIPNW